MIRLLMLLVAFVCVCVLHAQIDALPLSDTLEVLPVIRLKGEYYGNSDALMTKDYIMVGHPDDTYSVQTLEKVSVRGLDIAYNYQYRGRRWISVFNKEGRRVLHERNAGLNEVHGYGPSILDDQFIYYKEDSIKSYSIIDDSVKTVSHEEDITSPILNYAGNLFYVKDQKTIVVRNLESGKVVDRLYMQGVVSSMELKWNSIFLWVEGKGVHCVDFVEDELVISWVFTPANMKLAYVHLAVDKSSVVFSAGGIYSIDRDQGEINWFNESSCVGNSLFLRERNGLIYLYNECKAQGEVPAPLEILDKQTGELRFSGWTGSQFPPDTEWGVNELDFLGPMSFSFTPDNSTLFGLRGVTLHPYRFIR